VTKGRAIGRGEEAWGVKRGLRGEMGAGSRGRRGRERVEDGKHGERLEKNREKCRGQQKIGKGSERS